MDIANIAPSERTIEIHHPANEAELMEIRVSLMSINDKRMKKIKRRIHDEKLRLEARGKNFKSEDIEDNLQTMCFEAMTGWEWYGEDATFHGEKPEFNKKNVLKVFTECEWFLDQVSEGVSEERAFFTKSNVI